MAWTEERVEILKRRWAEGLSASAIAKELGSVTRNAVIGKVHRLGLSNRAAPTASGATYAAPGSKETKASASAPKATGSPAEPKKAEAPVPIVRKTFTAGQPLPPQPSANEISPETLARVSEIEKSAKKIGLMDLTERTCKWPIGDPATDQFWFCGLSVQQGKPYCEVHVDVAFQPVSSRRERRR